MKNNKPCVVCGTYLTEKQIKRGNIVCSRQCGGFLLGKTTPTSPLAGRYPRKYNYDIHFLDYPTDFNHYFLGLWIADGHLDINRMKVRLKLIDKDVIENIAKIVNYKNKITIFPPKNISQNYQYSLCFAKPIFEKLYGFGYTFSRKTGKEFIPGFIDETRFDHFLRGFIDGDGCLSIGKGKYKYFTISMVSSNLSFLEAIFAKIKKLIHVDGGYIRKERKKNCYLYTLGFGHYDSILIGNYIYKNDIISIKRKKEIYLKGKKLNVLRVIPKDGRQCSVEDCNEQAVEKGLCKTHYVLDCKEYNKNYYIKNRAFILEKQKLKYDNNETYRTKFLISCKKYRDKHKNDPEYRRKKNLANKKWREKKRREKERNEKVA